MNGILIKPDKRAFSGRKKSSTSPAIPNKINIMKASSLVTSPDAIGLFLVRLIAASKL